MKKDRSLNVLDELIESGRSGFFPLFYPEWIKESFYQDKKMQKLEFSFAAEKVHSVYENIKRHQSLERKRTALLALKEDERREFIRCFLKVVEFRSLNNIRELH